MESKQNSFSFLVDSSSLDKMFEWANEELSTKKENEFCLLSINQSSTR
jgi:hypothetical protein